MSYNNKERRKPLAGIPKDTYVDIAVKSGESKELAELDYDMLACIESKIGRILDNCECRFKQCEKRFVARALPNLDLSRFAIILVLGAIFVSVGYGILHWSDVMAFFK